MQKMIDPLRTAAPDGPPTRPFRPPFQAHFSLESRHPVQAHLSLEETGHVPFKKIGSSCPTAAGPCAPRSRPHSVGQNYRRDVALSQRLPKTEAAQTCAVMRAAYQLDAKQGMAKMQKQAEWLQREHPDAAAALREGLAERPSPSTPWACRRR